MVFFQWMLEALKSFVPRILQLLPRSPFLAFRDIAVDIPYLSMINWLVPLSEIIAVVEAWIAAIALYYLYSVVARWIKLIT